MLTMRDVLMEEERRQEIMHRAAYGRFVQQVTPANKKNCLLCIHFGNTLVRLGRHLQTRYATQSTSMAARTYTAANSEIQMQSR